MKGLSREEQSLDICPSSSQLTGDEMDEQLRFRLVRIQIWHLKSDQS